MYLKRSQARSNFIVFLLGVVGGGLLMALVTKAIPKMISQMMSNMMQTMMARMKESGFDPSVM